MKLRFIEPGELPYRFSIRNFYTYNKYIRNPSIGLMTLATIASDYAEDVLMYSESISKVKWNDVFDADAIFISIFTFNANRGYEIAQYIKQNSNATVIIGGLHASMNYTEAIEYCDYVMLGEGDNVIKQVIDYLHIGKTLDFSGIAYKKNETIINYGMPEPPNNIDIIPNRNLVYKYKKMSGYNTLWPQVHASRGCPYNCDYCALIRHFGHSVRTRTPNNVIEDIKESIEFHDKGHFRLAKALWITDDNFFADRKWAIEILNKIIDSGIKYNFSIQARYEVGFDNEMLKLLKKAGFFELSLGIEFLEDESFKIYNKDCSYNKILKSVKNIQAAGLNVRGLFIVGSDEHKKGIGKKISEFVINNDIKGVLIQSMYFVPGTPVYENNKTRLIHQDWSKYNGNVVHRPKNISAYDLQLEIIEASRRIYSKKRLFEAILKKRGLERILFIGEYFWQRSVRHDLKDGLEELKEV